ncbi:hypothetical protein [Vibrio sp. VB16]|uniref:hypothetical protein n=1 Tax=Vibrio sp. VB16 TaxID=2785746 RepID=UPI00189FE32C|nr:hypothetical protein [Vibrio sp. VB16]UGA53562.1 hypothetical protein IUZ65_009625 [Vibrio sp. VB16]
MKKILFLSLALLSACSTTSGLDPDVSYSGFDNAKIVNITPHGNACEGMVCTGLGAQWSSDKPKTAILLVKIFNDYAGVIRAELNIDGRKVELTPTSSVTDFQNQSGMNTSLKGFVVNISLIESIISSDRTWLRVTTPTGYIEDAVIDGETDSKAYHALTRFIAQVKANG